MLPSLLPIAQKHCIWINIIKLIKVDLRFLINIPKWISEHFLREPIIMLVQSFQKKINFSKLKILKVFSCSVQARVWGQPRTAYKYNTSSILNLRRQYRVSHFSSILDFWNGSKNVTCCIFRAVIFDKTCQYNLRLYYGK